jgi:DNA excision repair protein ERCC-2
MRLLFRHPTVREGQRQMLEDVIATVENGRVLLAHAPCGIGKTDASLSPAISYALEHDKKVLFLTPKLSQHKVGVSVAKGIAQKYGVRVGVADVVGRKQACAHPVFSVLDYDEFYSACEEARKNALCSYYINAQQPLSVPDHLYSSQEVLEWAKSVKVCPYEVMVKRGNDAVLVVADYFHFFLPYVRDMLFKKWDVKAKDVIVVVDEAHNLPFRVIEHFSTSFNTFFAKKVDEELKELGEQPLGLAEFLMGLIGESEEKIVDKDVVERLPLPFDVEKSVEWLSDLGVRVLERGRQRSALLRFAHFLSSWYLDAPSVRIVRKKKRTVSLIKRLLDPSAITKVINEVHAAILMSATLIPPEMYVNVLGIDEDRSVVREYHSPFPDEHRQVIVVKGLTTRFSQRNEQTYKRLAFAIDQFFDNSTAVFFPSYELMDNVLHYVVSSPKFVQRPDMSVHEVARLVSDFSRYGGLLAGVQGGSLSEGVDFANNEIKTLLVVGLALEEMTLERKALIEYYQKKFGKGKLYAYDVPAMTKALQAAGRAIRKESDVASIIFLDERFAWYPYRALFPNTWNVAVLPLFKAVSAVKSFRRSWNV